MNRTITTRLAALVIVLGLMLPAVGPARALTCQVNPNNVPITLDYHGATLNVSGQSPAADDLIVRIGNQPGESHYKYIGKAGGVFWMKKGDVAFKNVPGVYLLYTTRDVDQLLDAPTRQADQLGYPALKEAVEMESPSPELQGDETRWKDEFLRFKEKQKVYAIHTGGVSRQGDAYQVEVAWPYQAPPGSYTVQVLAVKDGRVTDRAQADFTVERAGAVAWLSNLAFNNSALYGIMAVIVAIIAGFAVGMIFRKGGGAH